MMLPESEFGRRQRLPGTPFQRHYRYRYNARCEIDMPGQGPGRLAAVWITSTREEGLAKIFATWAGYIEFRHSARTLESVGAATWATFAGRVLTGRGPFPGDSQ